MIFVGLGLVVLKSYVIPGNEHLPGSQVVFVQLFGISHKSLFLKCQAHRLNVWYICMCLHEWLISMVDAGIYTIHGSYGKSIPGVWVMFVVSKCLSRLDTWSLFVVLCQAATDVAVESSPVLSANFTRTKIRRILRGLALITTPQSSCVWFASPNSSVIWRKKVEIAVKKGELVIRTTHSCLVACSLIIVLIVILPLLLRMMISPFCYSSIYHMIY